jgi:hypothetical protein
LEEHQPVRQRPGRGISRGAPSVWWKGAPLGKPPFHLLLGLVDTGVNKPAGKKPAPLVDSRPRVCLVVEDDAQHLATAINHGAGVAAAMNHDRFQARAAWLLAPPWPRLQLALFFGRNQQSARRCRG